MADTRLDLIIRAQDEATKKLQSIEKQLDGITDGTKRASKGFDGFKDTLTQVGAISAVAFTGLTVGVKKVMDVYTEAQSSQLGFEATAKKLHIPIDALNASAQRLSADGLIPLTTAQSGLQNLMQAGLTDVEQMERLMRNFKDEAVFGKSASIDLSTAVSNLSESFKTESSSLGNLSGITENYSDILEKGAAAMGKKVSQLNDAERAQAKYIGLLQIGAASEGNSLKATESLAGAQARFATATTNAQIAIGEALAPALERLFAAITPVVNSITDWVKENPQLVSTLTQVAAVALGVGTALGGIAIAINPVTILFAKFALIAAGVGAAIYALKVAWENDFLGIRSSVEAFGVQFNATMEAVKPIIESVKTFVTENWNTIVGVFEWAGNIIMSTLKAALDYVSLAFKNTVDVILTAVRVFSAVLQGDWGKAWEEVAGLAQRIFDRIKQAGESFLQAILSVFGLKLDEVKLVVQEKLDAVVSFFSEKWNAIKEATTSTMGSISSTISTTWDRVKGFTKTKLEETSSTIGSIWSSVSKNTGTAWDNINTLVSSAWDTMKTVAINLGSAVVQAVEGIWEKIKQSVQNLISQSYQWGVDLIQGMINGIGAMAQNAVNSVKSVASSMSSAVTGFFGIQSPSKLMKQYGEWTMEGLAIGITKAGSQAVAAMQTQLEATGLSNISGQEAQSMATPDIVLPPQEPTLAGNTSNSSTTVVVNVNTMIGEEEYAERLGEQIVKTLSYSTAF